MKKWKQRIRRICAVVMIVAVVTLQVPDLHYVVYAAMDPMESLESYIESDLDGFELLASDSNSLYLDMGDPPGDYGVMPLVVGVDDAFLVICKLVFAACGVVVSGSNLESMSNQFYYWLQARAEEWSEAFRAANVVKTLTIGASAAGIAELIKAAKAFLGTITGYGTSAKSYTVAVPSGAQYEADVAAGLNHFFSYKYDVSSTGDSYTYADVFYEGNVKPLAVYKNSGGYYYGIYGVTDSEPLVCRLTGYKNMFAGFVFYKRLLGATFGTKDFKEIFKAMPVPAFSSLYAASYYVMTGMVRDASEWLNPTANIEIARSVVDAQTTDVSADDTAIVIPELALLEQLLANVATKEDVKAALKNVITLEYAGDVVIPSVVPDPSESESTSDPVLPWVPDITGRLDGILNGLSGLGDKIMSIPTDIVNGLEALGGKLAEIGDSLLSIPAQLVDFFTIDTAAVTTTYADLEQAFVDRFSGINQLGEVFHVSRAFDRTVPYFTMPTPEPFKFAIHTDTIVVLDLRPFEEQFVWVRRILNAILWYAFATWFINQFDVKFYIG